MQQNSARFTAFAIAILSGGCAAATGLGRDDANSGDTSSALKCSQGDPDCNEPEPGEGGNSPIDPPGSYRPDAMVQMSVFGCDLPQVVQVMAMAKKQVPGGRASCIDGELRVGAWRKPKGTTAQRDAAMNALSPRADDESFGLFISGEGVHRQISAVWSSMAKRWSIEEEKPDPDGSIRLSYLRQEAVLAAVQSLNRATRSDLLR